jgi:hypothetical protein
LAAYTLDDSHAGGLRRTAGVIGPLQALEALELLAGVHVEVRLP